MCASLHDKEKDSMRVFINKWFMRFTRKEDIANASLLEAVKRLEAGEFNADLGGGVISSG